ncbi:Uncharacterised protein [Bordetella pertussis]|nr:Uncharacterised protein [Bordetella pertussis]
MQVAGGIGGRQIPFGLGLRARAEGENNGAGQQGELLVHGDVLRNGIFELRHTAEHTARHGQPRAGDGSRALETLQF